MHKKIFYFIKKLLKSITGSYFLKDKFVLAIILIGLFSNLSFFHFIKEKSNTTDVFLEASLISSGYDFVSEGENLFGIPLFLLIFFILNIILARLGYKYDILASYVLISAALFFAIVYFFSTLIFLDVV